MEIALSMALPRDHSTLPLVRHLCKYAMWEIGVTPECAADVQLALTEACANVVEHSTADDDYEVHIALDGERCQISVIDTGHGFDSESVATGAADRTAENGRGISLMRALVDSIAFQSEPESGTMVHLVKRLEFSQDAQPEFIAKRMHVDGG
jgi:serine/threonine-protein kinase RsbW